MNKIMEKSHLIIILFFVYFFVFFNCSINAQINLEGKIKEQLPENIFLREYEKIPGTKLESYIGIYIENYSITEVQKENDMWPGLYSSCPEQTLGQTISGVYHFFLFQENKIISDIIIPPAYSEDNSNVQELCYYNTEENLCRYFEDGQNCDGKSQTKLRKAKLINFRDCTGSGKRFDFVLVGTTEVCGFVDYLVAGYNEKLNSVEIYKIKHENNIYQWYSRFYPDERGEAVFEILCDDHGNDLYTKYTYRFNKSSRMYELIDVVETPCE